MLNTNPIFVKIYLFFLTELSCVHFDFQSALQSCIEKNQCYWNLFFFCSFPMLGGSAHAFFPSVNPFKLCTSCFDCSTEFLLGGGGIIMSSSCFVKMLAGLFQNNCDDCYCEHHSLFLRWHFTDDWGANFKQPCHCAILVSYNGGIIQCGSSCNNLRQFQFGDQCGFVLDVH